MIRNTIWALFPLKHNLSYFFPKSMTTPLRDLLNYIFDVYMEFLQQILAMLLLLLCFKYAFNYASNICFRQPLDLSQELL